MVTKSRNKSIALEFFANAFHQKYREYRSDVKGTVIYYSPHNINCVLGLTTPKICDVERKRLSKNWHRSQEACDELLVGLMKEGK